MPTYEYRCGSCGVIEVFQRITDDALVQCPQCGSTDFRRLVSAAAFHLKGSGWYKTDYGSGSSGKTGGGTNGKSHTGDGAHSSDSSSEKTDKNASDAKSEGGSAAKSTEKSSPSKEAHSAC